MHLHDAFLILSGSTEQGQPNNKGLRDVIKRRILQNTTFVTGILRGTRKGGKEKKKTLTAQKAFYVSGGGGIVH